MVFVVLFFVAALINASEDAAEESRWSEESRLLKTNVALRQALQQLQAATHQEESLEEVEKSVGCSTFGCTRATDVSELCKGQVAWLRPKNRHVVGKANIVDDSTGTKCIFNRVSDGKILLVAVDPYTCQQVKSGDMVNRRGQENAYKDISRWKNRPGVYSLDNHVGCIPRNSGDSINCVAPPNPSFTVQAKRCRRLKGTNKADCLNNNRMYDNFNDAFNQCRTLPKCAFITRGANGKFWLRRSDDDDDSSTDKMMPMPCWSSETSVATNW